MAIPATARETVFALRRQIAKLEGRLAERLDAPPDKAADDRTVLRRHGVSGGGAHFLETGANRLDRTLGGGLPRAALTEIHTDETRNAGAAAGFVLALAAMLVKSGAGPLLWIGAAEISREAGSLYAPGLGFRFGIAAENLLFARAAKVDDGLWIAEEAAQLKSLSAVVLELRGNPSRLDLTATRRLHHRAIAAGRPVFLLRQGARAGPTAAPVRLVVHPAPSGPRRSVSGVLDGFIGPPGFDVRLSKSPAARPGRFILEWNVDERAFTERDPQISGAVVSSSGDGPDIAAAPGAVLAFRPGASEAAAAGGRPSRQEHAAHRRA